MIQSECLETPWTSPSYDRCIHPAGRPREQTWGRRQTRRGWVGWNRIHPEPPLPSRTTKDPPIIGPSPVLSDTQPPVGGRVDYKYSLAVPGPGELIRLARKCVAATSSRDQNKRTSRPVTIRMHSFSILLSWTLDRNSHGLRQNRKLHQIAVQVEAKPTMNGANAASSSCANYRGPKYNGFQGDGTSASFRFGKAGRTVSHKYSYGVFKATVFYTSCRCTVSSEKCTLAPQATYVVFHPNPTEKKPIKSSALTEPTVSAKFLLKNLKFPGDDFNRLAKRAAKLLSYVQQSFSYFEFGTALNKLATSDEAGKKLFDDWYKNPDNRQTTEIYINAYFPRYESYEKMPPAVQKELRKHLKDQTGYTREILNRASAAGKEGSKFVMSLP
ncbi:hypothetical protein ACK3TF_004661 [Chlorella vulgaris]